MTPGPRVGREEVERRLFDLLVGPYDTVEVSRELREFEVDSLHLVEIAVLAEDAWGVDLLASDMDEVQTAADVVDLIAAHTHQG